MKILSIDWDFFFPDSTPYDWGHRESPLFIDMLWPTRVTNHNLLTKKPVIEEYQPEVPTDFWRIVTNHPSRVLIAESHCRMFDLLIFPEPAEVVNLDAHHDLGYAPGDKNLNLIHAGNWAWAARKLKCMSDYTLHYPEWRRGHEEPRRKDKTKVVYGLPEPAEYDLVFICRSGAWTPPWYDDQFWQLTEGAYGSTHEIQVELHKRDLTLKMALEMRQRQEQNLKKMGIVSMPSSKFVNSMVEAKP
jgi:hypothetical protein